MPCCVPSTQLHNQGINITANNIKLNNRSIAVNTLFRDSQKNYRYPPDKHIDGQEIKT